MGDLIQSPEQRMARLEKYVAKVEEALKQIQEDYQSGKNNPLSEDEIKYHLATDPVMIAEVGIELAHFRRAYSYAQIDTKLIYASIWREINSKKDELKLSNAKDREAYVLSQPEYVKALRQEIEWKYNLDRMTVIYERYTNTFISSRKLAGLAIENYQAQDNYTKYNQEVGE